MASLIPLHKSATATTGLSWQSRRVLAATPDSRIDLSAVAEHAAVNGHKIDWAPAKVIDSAKTTQARKVKEALHITRKAPKMNKDQGMILSASWHGALGMLNRMVS